MVEFTLDRPGQFHDPVIVVFMDIRPVIIQIRTVNVIDTVIRARKGDLNGRLVGPDDNAGFDETFLDDFGAPSPLLGSHHDRLLNFFKSWLLPVDGRGDGLVLQIQNR